MDNEKVYYKGGMNEAGVIVADTSKPFDKNGKPLANHEIVDGIAQREVNELKGNK